ncbi:MAG: shikimate kinase [Peptococcaceae bacterium]|jgi:shikimate kinase|nr:shikimate kinase [Peptococcaceae bacterium]
MVEPERISSNINNIILVGFMAAGKSSIGKKLARRLGWKYIDTDAEIVEVTGLKIPTIFKKYGEVRFRSEEKLVVKKLREVTSAVIATGGGTVEDPDNWSVLEELGIIIHLFVPLEEAFKRIGKRSERPLLTRSEQEIYDLWQSRLKIYNKASIFLDTTNKDLDDIVNEIIEHLKGGSVDNVSKN